MKLSNILIKMYADEKLYLKLPNQPFLLNTTPDTITNEYPEYLKMGVEMIWYSQLNNGIVIEIE